MDKKVDLHNGSLFTIRASTATKRSHHNARSRTFREHPQNNKPYTSRYRRIDRSVLLFSLWLDQPTLAYTTHHKRPQAALRPTSSPKKTRHLHRIAASQHKNDQQNGDFNHDAPPCLSSPSSLTQSTPLVACFLLLRLLHPKQPPCPTPTPRYPCGWADHRCFVGVADLPSCRTLP